MNEFDAGELQLLRDARGENVEMDSESLSTGRAKLEREIGSLSGAGLSEGRERRTLRRRGWVSITAFAGLAAAVVLGAVLLPPMQTTSHAEAAEILLAAADQVEFNELPVAADQYLRVAAKGVNLSSYTEQSGDEVYYQRSGREVVYISGDRISHVSGLIDDPHFEGLLGSDQTAEKEALARESFEEAGAGSSYPSLEVSPHGANSLKEFSGEDEDGPYQGVTSSFEDDYVDAPREPDALRKHILNEAGPHNTSDDEVVFEWIRPVIFDPSEGAGLRAACFRVLAKLEGATVSAEQVKLGDRKGTALSFSARGDTREDLVFDPDTGSLIGSQTVLMDGKENFKGIDVGTVLSWGEYRVSVVDAIPPVNEETW